MMRLSRLADRVGYSGTLAADQRRLQLDREGRDIIDLAVGQLDFDTPDPVRAAGVAAIQAGRTRYTPVAGIEALRRAVRAKFERENGLIYTDSEVIVGTGAKSVVYHGILALLDPEDVMIVPSPAWPSYVGMAALAGGRVVEARLDPRNGWTLRVEALLRAVAEARGRARVLIVNSPHNPTGALYPADEQARIAEVARGEDLWVISDEIYEHLSYEGPTTSMAALPHMRERTLTVNGVSKSFAMTGWRIGYAGGPAELIQAMAAFQGHTTGNASSISQHAAEAALRLMLEGDPELVAERRRIREAMMRRRDLACRELAALPGLQCVRPGGAFYVFADVSPWIGRELQGRFIAGSAELAAYLLEEAGVSVVAGAVFGDDRCLRLSFATSLEELSVGLQRIKRALA